MDQTGQQEGGQPEKMDVSRQTLIVLVVLAIVVSLLGSFTVIRETSGMHRVLSLNEEGTASTQSSQGKVSLTVVDSNIDAAVVDNRATGKVVFEIVK